MPDKRISEHAKILVNYCCEVKRGDFVLILAHHPALPLISELASEIGKAGANYLAINSDSSLQRAHMLSSDDETLEVAPKQFVNLVKESDEFIQIFSSLNSQELSDVPPHKLKAVSKANAVFYPIIEQKKWNITAFPTESLAQDAKMSMEAYTDFLYSAMLRDWPKLASEMQVLYDKFAKTKKVHIVGKDTDISFSIEGRKPIVDEGKKNLPGGEVFISPIEASVNGKVYFDLPVNFLSQDIKGARLEFKNGEVVSSSAEEGSELLKELLTTDEGAKRLGELGIGMNRGIDRFTKNILFDEKMGDTVHMAAGLGFEESGGTNKSGLHIDMIKSMKDEGVIYFDDSPIYKDGKFIWE